MALKIAESVNYQNRDSVIIASLLHDVGKAGDYGKQNYTENYLKTRDKEGNPMRSATKPFCTNKDLLYIPHEVRSIAIIRQFFALTEEEEHAIYYHNGKYTHTGYDLKETPLQMILHFADLWSSRVTEKSDEEEKEF
jgi:23S rRNA maturation-related 3'-5' exoribonuclease YhaM